MHIGRCGRANVKWVKNAHQKAEESSKILQSRIDQLETELTASQEKHDSLLLEAAQMSDARIAELSEQLQQAISLKNEAIAELEQEREQASAAEEYNERSSVKEAEASARVVELEEVSRSQGIAEGRKLKSCMSN